MYEVKGIESQSLQNEVNQLNEKFDKLLDLTQSIASSSPHQPGSNPTPEQVHAIQNQPRQGFNNFYKDYPWRSHPNFSWKQPQDQLNQQRQYQPPPPRPTMQHQQHAPMNSGSSSSMNAPTQNPDANFMNQMQSMMQQMMMQQQQFFMQQTQTLKQELQQKLGWLEREMGKVAESTTKRELCQLPSQPTANPRNYHNQREQCPPTVNQVDNSQQFEPLQYENSSAVSMLRNGKLLMDNLVKSKTTRKAQRQAK